MSQQPLGSPRRLRPIGFRSAAVAALVVLLTVAAAGAQDETPPDLSEDAPWRMDPYTKGDQELLAAAGYTHIGHFPLGDGHDTRRVEQVLGKVQIRWIETEHFRLGVNLPAQKVSRDKRERGDLREELERLSAKLPGVRPRAIRELDPWLRAHLYAQRLEDLYRQVQDLLGVRDADFPGVDAPFFRGEAPPDQKWMGRGPYLGVKGKFLVLLFEKQSTCGRYLQTFTGAAPDAPSRWYFLERDCFLYTCSTDFHDSYYALDRTLHGTVTHNVTVNLLDAYKGYSYRGQVWWQEGIAHWIRRQHHDDVHAFSGFDGDGQRAFSVDDWGERVAQRLQHGLVTPWRELLDQTDPNRFSLVDHWAAWTRIDFLLETHGEAALAEFVDGVRGFVDTRGNPPADDALAKQQLEVFSSAFGADVDSVDDAWRDWVRRRYKAK